ncbi:MAG: hypothetical protein GC162_16870 [Planctomycetes bacterium]|nr:hypothetical protein [Planctomycetota bacterium]
MSTITATKTARTLQSSTTNAAGGTTTGSAIDLTAAMGLAITAKVTNGATGPTVGCTFKVEVSNDNTNWKTFASYLAATDNSGVSEFALALGAEWMYARTVFTGNTGQGVTVEAFGHELTSLASA